MVSEIDRIKQAYGRRIEGQVINRYSPLIPGELYMLQRREEELLRLLRRHGITNLSRLRILEIGCGRGVRLADWCRWGAMPGLLHGIDIMETFICEARNSLPAGARLVVGSADQLPYADCSFDVIVQLTVFTSILDPNVKRKVASEMRRVAAPGAIIVWYDFRYPSPRNRDVRPIGLKELRGLFPGWSLDVRAMTLLPPLARIGARFSWAVCRFVEKIMPPLRSHYLALLRKS
jgi:ubiquinone/menaquinone biosynthesis C-methylase UbiE